MSDAGVVLRRETPGARERAAAAGLAVAVSDAWSLPWPRTLFVAPGTLLPWDLAASGFAFLGRWDAAAPLTREHALAQDLGTPAERERTRAVVLDLRILAYSPELLFVRATGAGPALLAAWRAECDGGDERLAFLRALWRVKPLFCALPRAWLADRSQREALDRPPAPSAPTPAARQRPRPRRLIGRRVR